MKKILVVAGSNSSTSINQKLLNFLVTNIEGFELKNLKLTDFPLSIYSEDEEKEKGYAINLSLLKNEIAAADAIILSVNEHNGTVSAFFKNIIDWLSRLDRNFLENKKILLLSTSNGKRGGASALEYCKNVLPRFGAEIVESVSFPSFSDNFSEERNEVTNEILLLGLLDILQNFLHKIA